MLKYLTKFVLDILPSIAATIIGAYIVHYYVIPSAVPKDTAAAVATTAPKADVSADPKPDAGAGDKASFARGVAEKAAIEKTAERAADKAPDGAPFDSRKKHSPRTANRASDPAADLQDERRDANDLARAAIERLRPAPEPRTVAIAPPVASLPGVQPPAMPPLPPATTVAPPSPEVFSAGTGAVMTTERLPQQVSATSRATARPTPPADIPTAPPIDLHTDVVERTTVAEDVMTAAKSVFHAVLPR